MRSLGLAQPKAVILLSGGADEMDAEMMAGLTELFSRGIARAAADAGALVIDGGTASGVMKLMGQGIADRRRQTPLLGVVPSGKVSYPSAEAEDGDNERTPQKTEGALQAELTGWVQRMQRTLTDAAHESKKEEATDAPPAAAVITAATTTDAPARAITAAAATTATAAPLAPDGDKRVGR